MNSESYCVDIYKPPRRTVLWIIVLRFVSEVPFVSLSSFEREARDSIQVPSVVELGALYL